MGKMANVSMVNVMSVIRPPMRGAVVSGPIACSVVMGRVVSPAARMAIATALSNVWTASVWSVMGKPMMGAVVIRPFVGSTGMSVAALGVLPMPIVGPRKVNVLTNVVRFVIRAISQAAPSMRRSVCRV